MAGVWCVWLLAAKLRKSSIYNSPGIAEGCMGYAGAADKAGKVKMILELIDLHSWSRHSREEPVRSKKI